MRALALVLVLAPAALAGLVSPPPTAWANGCTPCECGAAMCIDGAFYWYNVNITAIPERVLVGEVFHIEASLFLTATNTTDPDEDVTSGPTQLFVTYQYVDPDDERTLPKSGSIQFTDNATYPGEYTIPLALAEPGTVDIDAWTVGGHSEKRRVEVLAAGEETVDDEQAKDEAPMPLVGALVALVVAAVVVRRRRS